MKPARHRRPWSERDDKALLFYWENVGSLEQLAMRLGRTAVAVRDRALDLGLPLGCPPGWEYLTAATKRVGYANTFDLRRVLLWAGVKVWTVRTLSPLVQWRRHFVCPDSVDRAIAKWNQTEPVSAAAARIGVSQPTLCQWLKWAGVEDTRKSKKQHWHVTEDDVKRAQAMCLRPDLVGRKRAA
jgi:hypothetical protein